MKADLHLHSHYSDGGYWPFDIMQKAAEAELELVCVSDHDTLGSCPEAMSAAANFGIKSWPAVEIDCVDEELKYRSEILAYFPNNTYSSTDKMLNSICQERRNGIKKMMEKASDYFNLNNFTLESIIQHKMENRSPNLPEPDYEKLRFSKTDLFLELQRQYAIPKDMEYREFKQTYFEKGLFSNIKFSKPSIEDIAKVVQEDNGVLVVPHIGHEFKDSYEVIHKESKKLEKMLQRFYNLGIRGIELYFYRNFDTDDINNYVKSKSKDFGFFNTYGSDHHGPGSHRKEIGEFYGDFHCFPVLDINCSKKKKKEI